MQTIPFVDAVKQTCSIVLNGRRCTMCFTWNKMIDRWSMDLDIDAVPALKGRRLVPFNDLLGPFDLGLGAMFVGDYEGTGEPTTYDAMVSGRHRLYHLTPSEVINGPQDTPS